MVVKLETVSALYADVYPSCSKLRDRMISMECIVSECPRRQKQRPASLPALVEDDAEPMEAFELEQQPRRPVLLKSRETVRRQQSISPPRRERLRRQLLPSLSEDEEP